LKRPRIAILGPLRFWPKMLGDYCESETRRRSIDLPALRRELVDGLAKAGLPNAQIEIDLVDTLQRHKQTGKLKRFIPLKP
jgi:hypothetical protein